MKIRKFYAKETREAMKLVRETLGPDAVILSNKPKGEGVELLAAPDMGDDPMLDLVSDSKPKLQDIPKKKVNVNDASSLLLNYTQDNKIVVNDSLAREKVIAPNLAVSDKFEEKTIDVETSGEKAILSLKEEMEALKGLLKEQLSGLVWGNIKYKNPVQASILRQLTQSGFSSEIVRRLVQTLDENISPEDAISHIKELLAKSIQITPNLHIDSPGIYCLIGTSGVGKTSCVTKLAAKCAIEHGVDSVVMVTTDSTRIGSQDQLKIYGKILNIDVVALDDISYLPDALEELKFRKFIFIDTQALNLNDSKISTFSSIIESCQLPISLLLVFAANSQSTYIKSTFKTYARLGISSAIITKLDESFSLGESLSSLIEYKIPLSYISSGTQIPDDIKQMSNTSIVHRAIAMGRAIARDFGDDELARIYSEVEIDEI